MPNSYLKPLLVGITAFILLSACGEESNVSKNDETRDPPQVVKISKSDNQPTKTTKSDLAMSDSVMNQPVDFSTPENVEKTIALIRSEEGESALNELKRAMQTLKKNNPPGERTRQAILEREQAFNDQMDGNTPNEIINLAKQMR